jgi:hypothetical protein
MTRLIDVYGVNIKFYYDASSFSLSCNLNDKLKRIYLHDKLKRICEEHGTLEFFIFLYDFVRLHGVIPILKDSSGNYPDFVAEVLAETSVDITDKAAILAIDKILGEC